jgi:hypothetical protein
VAGAANAAADPDYRRPLTDGATAEHVEDTAIAMFDLGDQRYLAGHFVRRFCPEMDLRVFAHLSEEFSAPALKILARVFADQITVAADMTTKLDQLAPRHGYLIEMRLEHGPIERRQSSLDDLFAQSRFTAPWFIHEQFLFGRRTRRISCPAKQGNDQVVLRPITTGRKGRRLEETL